MLFDLEDVITAWKVQYGEKRTGKKYGTEFYAIPIQERKELLRILVQTLKSKGKDQDFFKQNMTKNSIAASCFPPIIYDKEARRRGYEAVWRELREIVAEFWPDQDVISAKDNLKIDNIIPEETEVDANIHTGYWKELDRSALQNIAKPNREIDLEASKLLGFKDE